MFLSIPVMSLDIFSSVWDFITETIPNAIGSAITNALTSLIGKILYYIIVKGLLGFVNLIYQFFEVFAGLKKVKYDGTNSYLINVFFDNSLISKLYIGMACIGIVMVFGFGIMALVRKTFDIDDKNQKPLSSILKNCFKSIFVILILSLCVTGILNSSNVLMQSVSYLFDNAENIGKISTIEYTDSQYAKMSHILNTIGNYSLNPSYDSRYNVNSCFNEIREDLYDLQQQGVFSGHYETKDENGKKVENWMTLLQSIVESADISSDVYMNVYYESLNKALVKAMDSLTNNTSLGALKTYTFPVYSSASEDVTLDRAIFLAGTTSAAKDAAFNQNAYITDSLRGPFYVGEKNIYDISQVNGAFDIRLGSIDYLMIGIVAFFTIKYLFQAILLCASRIFSMISLYLVAPPIVATMPWDDGEKFKQWVQAFVIQCFGVFGTVIPMRLVVTFVPIIISDRLVMFPNSSFLNITAKLVLIIGALISTSGFSRIFSGILSGNAGMMSAGSLAVSAGAADRGFGALARGSAVVAGAGAKLAGGTVSGALGIAGAVTGASTLYGKARQGISNIGSAISKGYNALKTGGGIPGVAASAWRNNRNIGSGDKGSHDK